jgi:hypothetical protein
MSNYIISPLILILLIFNAQLSRACDEPVCTYEKVISIYGWLDDFKIGRLNDFTERAQEVIDMAADINDIIPTLTEFINGIEHNIEETASEDIADLYNSIHNQVIQMKKFLGLVTEIIKIDPSKIVLVLESAHGSVKSCLLDKQTTLNIEEFFSPFLNLPEEINIPFCLMEKMINGLDQIINISFLSNRWNEFKATFESAVTDMVLIKNVMIKFRGPKSNYEIDLEDCSEVNEFKMSIVQKSFRTISQMAKLYIETVKAVIETLCSIAEGIGDTTDIKLKSFPDVGGVLGEIKTPTNFWSIGSGLLKPLDVIPELFDYVSELVEIAISRVCKTSDILFIEYKANLRTKLGVMADDYLGVKDELHMMISNYNIIEPELYEMVTDYNKHKNNKTLLENTYINNLQNQTILINSYVNNLLNNTIMINDYVWFMNTSHESVNNLLCIYTNLTKTVDDYVKHNRLYIPDPKPENGDNICLKRH